ncbi:hypothetical protein E1B28_005083 [Marasmius oreades]|nr:uncharacterized protein E1B28_005083 [Marasmius oreades]KAG7097762.1 hypothetical protein E1B28_005083 [Marasmius oreades]
MSTSMPQILLSKGSLALLLTSISFSLLVNIYVGLELGLRWASASGPQDVLTPDEIPFPVMVPEAVLKTAPSLNYPVSSDGDRNWTTLVPPLSSGFIYHPRTQQFYSVSLYHQLHCLNALRKYISRGPELRLDDEVVTHTGHCLDYLREALLCHSDTTLEPVHDIIVPPDDRKNTSQHTDKVAQGWNVLHRCKDWAVVRRYLEDNWRSWPPEHRDSK